jgi:hypothetical protein
MPPVILVLHRKRRFDDGALSEMKLWLVPSPVRGSRHRFRYSLFYGGRGERLIGYDNEPGKGDHRHYGDREAAYHFISVERLVTNFLTVVHAMRHRLW